jgi:hypothetical protein
MIRVRPARASDYPAVCELMMSFFRTHNFSHLDVKITPEHCLKIARELIDKHILLVLLDGDKIVGEIGGVVTPFFLHETARMFQEIFFYIKTGYRGYAKFLLNALENVCADDGLTYVVMAHPNDGNLEKMKRFYIAKSYRPLEMHFVKRINL